MFKYGELVSLNSLFVQSEVNIVFLWSLRNKTELSVDKFACMHVPILVVTYICGA